MNANEAAIEEARRAAFDLDLLDSDLALTQRAASLTFTEAGVTAEIGVSRTPIT